MNDKVDLKMTEVADGLYLLPNVYQRIDRNYFAKIEIAAGGTAAAASSASNDRDDISDLVESTSPKRRDPK